MRTRHQLAALFWFVVLVSTIALAQEPSEAPLATAFTYQGRLSDGGAPATGAFDLQLLLFDAATTPPGVQVGGTIYREDVTVSDGLFIVDPDFGATVFTGQALWLEIGVRPGSSSGAFTTVWPRQPLSPAPFAMYSQAGTATDVQCAGCVNLADLAGGAASGGQVLTAAGVSTLAWQTPTWLTGTGSSGQVALWAGVSGLSGGDGLFFDAVNNRLGVNTNAPQDTLEISGNLRFPATISSSSWVLKLGSNRFLHAYGVGNTFLGLVAGNFTMGGSGGEGRFNTGLGGQALGATTTGQSNTAVGYFALGSNSSGSWNAALGSLSLAENTTGSGNAAVGHMGLQLNTTGSDNTAVGALALADNTTAGRNTAVGRYALYSQSYDNGGTAWDANNTAVGFYALYSNQPTSTSVGRRNTAVGAAAGDSLTGTNNTFLGYDADASVDLLSNAMALGSGARVDASNKVRIGNTSVTVIEGKVDWSFPSDLRQKKDVGDLPFGLDLVTQLRPVQYRLRDGNGRIDMGFIAQDIEAVLGDGFNLLGIGEDPERTLSLRRGDLIAPLVKAVQEQQEEIKAQQDLIGRQQTAIQQLGAALASQADRIGELARRVAALEGRPVARLR